MNSAYISEEDAFEYIATMGLSELSDPEALLKRASRAIDTIYGQRFPGMKLDEAQVLQWPRIGALLEGIPVNLAEATVELAILMDSGVDVFAQPGTYVTSESTSVGPISTSKTFAGSGHRINTLHKVSLMLAPLLLTPAFSARLVRG